MATLGIVLSERNAVRAKPDPRVGLVLLERTFYDPPRRAAMVRWTSMVRRNFPNAAVVPYAWHLVSHGPEDGTREHATRTLNAQPRAIGSLQDTPETRQAYEVTEICREAVGSDRIALRTPPSITPGAMGRRRVQAFVEARTKEGVGVIWEPSGLWEPAEALAVGRQLNAKVVLPAFEGGRPRYDDENSLTLVGAGAWLSVAPIGARQNLGGDQVDALVDHASEHRDATIIFSGRRALPALRTVAEALSRDD